MEEMAPNETDPWGVTVIEVTLHLFFQSYAKAKSNLECIVSGGEIGQILSQSHQSGQLSFEIGTELSATHPSIIPTGALLLLCHKYTGWMNETTSENARKENRRK
ncbi:hypothetical protein GPALN_016274 [Globodera pallida]|nr:hypothetical protein GPALN_016274 [Globodera pallida]